MYASRILYVTAGAVGYYGVVNGDSPNCVGAVGLLLIASFIDWWCEE